ncbi:MFS general substrate transporter [Meredithblackwellia eburnea MCA 4105]
MPPPRLLLANRWSNAVAIFGNCILAGAIFTFPLFSPPLARNLRLTMQQTSIIASASILGEYASAVLWGWLADRRGPGTLSWAAAVLFGVGYGMLGWRYNVSVQMQRDGVELPTGQWMFLAFYYFLSGCATAASYFSAIIASTKSYPSRHSGLAIGIPCSIFGLSPLFLSLLAKFFTSNNVASKIESWEVAKGELDPGRWLLFLAALLAAVNALGGLVLKELPWDDDHPPRRSVPTAQGGAPPTERSSLLPTSASTDYTTLPPPPPTESQPLKQFLSDPTFWLFGFAILLSIGPCEMTMASLGAIVESLLGFHILPTTSKPSSSDPASRALGLRTLHVQIISIANTVSRLISGAVSDWLSYSAAPSPPPTRSPSPAPLSRHSRSRSRSESISISLKAYFHQSPRLTRLAFLGAATAILASAFAFTALSLDRPAGLWILSVAVGTGYGTIFTLAPAIMRTVYPVKDFGRNFGLINWFSAFGALLFTPLYGVLSDVASDKQQQENGVCYGRSCWHDVFLVSSISTVFAGVLVLVLWRGWWRGRV